MSLPIISLEDFSEYNEALWAIVKNSAAELCAGRMTRLKRSSWQADLGNLILEDSDHEYVRSIRKWLKRSIGLAIDHLGDRRVVLTFLTVFIYQFNNADDSARTLLRRIQRSASSAQFGQSGIHNRQHNISGDMALDSDSEESDDDEADNENEDNTDDTYAGTTTSPSVSKQLPNFSPPTKRRNLGHPLPATSIVQEYSFEQFNSMPVVARDRRKWNHLLQTNPQFWQPLCQEWATDLDAVYMCRKRADLSKVQNQHFYEKLVEVLREFRQVMPSIYGVKKWREAVKVSGLYISILRWSDPSAIALWKAPFVIRCIRKHRIQETLLLVLLDWIPGGVMHGWTVTRRRPSSKKSAQAINNGAHLYKIIMKNADMIPREAYPSSVFFLLSLDNFQLAGVEWLGYALAARGFNVSWLDSPEQTKQMFDDVKRKLSRLSKAEMQNPKFPYFKLIIERTVAFGKTQKLAARHVLASRKASCLVQIYSTSDVSHQGGIDSTCVNCAHLVPEERCIQAVEVDVKASNESLIGCGVTKAPPPLQMKAIPIPHSKTKGTVKPIIHISNMVPPLQRISANEAIIDRCGMQLFRIMDKQNPGKMLDFWLYESFSEEILQKLIDHHTALCNTKHIKRGGQFDSYGTGKMHGKGVRVPKGGLPGDALTFYSGMDAITDQDIESLFNDAEDSMILSEVTRVLKFDIIKALDKDFAYSDRLGTSGSNTFLCSNYTSPLHRDNDAGTGLCAQFDLQALSEFDEYSFIHADYNIYFVSRRNSLWSFDGRRMHGTMLPSTKPLACEDYGDTLAVGGRWPPSGPDRPPRISNGLHKTKPKSNQAAAQKYHAARVHHNDIKLYWDSL